MGKSKVIDALVKLAEAKTAILEKMPWVNESKVEKAWAKVEEFQEWWEKKDKQQEELAPYAPPAPCGYADYIPGIYKAHALVQLHWNLVQFFRRNVTSKCIFLSFSPPRGVRT